MQGNPFEFASKTVSSFSGVSDTAASLATLRKRLSRTVGSEDVVAALPHYLIAWAGLSKAQLANAIKTALAQVANEVREECEGGRFPRCKRSNVWF